MYNNRVCPKCNCGLDPPLLSTAKDPPPLIGLDTSSESLVAGVPSPVSPHWQQSHLVTVVFGPHHRAEMERRIIG